ncbi:response regulator [Dongia sp.]|uniref:response regulator n=1 Tax=Dongia sp. TaxID=1977262 RepID=UPI0035AFE892
MTPPLPTPQNDEQAQWILLRLKPPADDDLLDFLEDESEDEALKSAQPWTLLIVDDDSEVHRAIELALMAVRIHGRALALSHCMSAAEARAMLERHAHPVDLVLLDVVMETADAGLILLDEMRSNEATRSVPVLLHTGQPGQAPEKLVRARYDIGGYLTKSTVTRQSLIAALEKTLGGATLEE